MLNRIATDECKSHPLSKKHLFIVDRYHCRKSQLSRIQTTTYCVVRMPSSSEKHLQDNPLYLRVRKYFGGGKRKDYKSQRAKRTALR